ncbi:hypothetical protein ACSBLW_18510 [Thioclava sp. FR2]|uniref:hypothetical protein n=1 Tax=Thioclava sp. FR2 TaxID=3445780 RepID=UPI003EB83DDF
MPERPCFGLDGKASVAYLKNADRGAPAKARSFPAPRRNKVKNMASEKNDTVIARMQPSLPRRVIGTGLLAALGLFFLAVATQSLAGSPALMIFLVAFSGLILWLAVRLWQGTTIGLELTETEFRDTTGRVLVTLDQVHSVEKGALALKPAGGFTIVTKTSGPRGWVPGLWWRAGNRIGVGGVTHRHEARFVAEMMDDLIKGNRPFSA